MVHEDIANVLQTREQIAIRIHELGGQISRDYQMLKADDELVIIPVLTGSIIFVADLIREIPLKMRISLVTVSSYPQTATESVGAKIVGGLPPDLAGKHVLIVDDILDSGGTIQLLRKEITRRNAQTVRVCVLLRKNIDSALQTPCEYIGFDIPDEYVVGYGLDYDNYYRNLPHVAVLKKDAL